MGPRGCWEVGSRAVRPSAWPAVMALRARSGAGRPDRVPGFGGLGPGADRPWRRELRDDRPRVVVISFTSRTLKDAVLAQGWRASARRAGSSRSPAARPRRTSPSATSSTCSRVAATGSCRGRGQGGGDTGGVGMTPAQAARYLICATCDFSTSLDNSHSRHRVLLGPRKSQTESRTSMSRLLKNQVSKIEISSATYRTSE
jgi:hypothetical protein